MRALSNSSQQPKFLAGVRTTRFSSDFVDELRLLTVALTWELQRGSRQGLTKAKALSRSITAFLCDLLSLMDRGPILLMVQTTTTTPLTFFLI